MEVERRRRRDAKRPMIGVAAGWGCAACRARARQDGRCAGRATVSGWPPWRGSPAETPGGWARDGRRRRLRPQQPCVGGAVVLSGCVLELQRAEHRQRRDGPRVIERVMPRLGGGARLDLFHDLPVAASVKRPRRSLAGRRAAGRRRRSPPRAAHKMPRGLTPGGSRQRPRRARAA